MRICSSFNLFRITELLLSATYYKFVSCEFVSTYLELLCGATCLWDFGGSNQIQIKFEWTKQKQAGQAIYTIAYTFSKSRNKWPSVVLVASLMFVAYLVVQIIQHWIFAFADPLWPCIKNKIIKTSMSRYAMHKSTAMPSLNAIA